MLLDGDVRIEAADQGGGALDFRHADVRRRMDNLPLQVRQRDHVVVDDAERADPGGGEVKEHRSAKPAGADHQHARAAKRSLSGAAHFFQYDMARVALEFVRREHRLKIGVNGTRNHRCAGVQQHIL